MNDAAVNRWQTAIAHSGVILWQVYSAITAYRSGDVLAHLLVGLGANAAPGTSLFVLTYRWWLLVPLIFAVLSVLSIRRLESKPAFSLIVLAAEVVVALALNIWWREAWFGPIFSMIRQVG